MTPYDHYEEAKTLASSLNAEGFPGHAQQLLDAMNEGKMGTEIFMILRTRLANLLSTAHLTETTKKRAGVLHAKIDEALK